MGSGELGSSGAVVDSGQFLMQKETMVSVGAGGTLGNGNYENWGESGMADNSQQTDTSTDVDTDEKSQVFLLCLIISPVLLPLSLLYWCLTVWKENSVVLTPFDSMDYLTMGYSPRDQAYHFLKLKVDWVGGRG